MGSKFALMRKIVVTTVVGGALVLGTTGAAGASAPTPTAASGTPAATNQLTPEGGGRLAHVSCSRATRALITIQKSEAGIAKGLPGLHRAQVRATAAGKTRKAARIGKMITRLERPDATARLQRLAAAIEARCNVAAPAVAPTKAR